MVTGRRETQPRDVYAQGSWEAYRDAVDDDVWSAFTPAATSRRAQMMRWLRENRSPESLTIAVMRGDIAWETLQGLAARKGARAAILQLASVVDYD